jgi:hypothetical protein
MSPLPADSPCNVVTLILHQQPIRRDSMGLGDDQDPGAKLRFSRLLGGLTLVRSTFPSGIVQHVLGNIEHLLTCAAARRWV